MTSQKQGASAHLQSDVSSLPVSLEVEAQRMISNGAGVQEVSSWLADQGVSRSVAAHHAKAMIHRAALHAAASPSRPMIFGAILLVFGILAYFFVAGRTLSLALCGAGAALFVSGYLGRNKRP
jgi:hypothetical protein